MARHIPGNPNIIVENMPGAGTLVATNHVFNVAPRDGTVIGMPSRSMPAAAVMKVANVRFDPVKFNWIGSPEVNHLVVYINNASAIKKPADLFEHELIVGATGLAQGITVGPYLLKNLLGMKLKIVTGYRSPGDMALAASRNEIEAFANTIGGAAGARRPWVEIGPDARAVQFRARAGAGARRADGVRVRQDRRAAQDPDLLRQQCAARAADHGAAGRAGRPRRVSCAAPSRRR